MRSFLLLIIFPIVYTNKTIELLYKYGYLKNMSDYSLSNVRDGVELFQEVYNLTVDGSLNNETLSLLESSRCGVKDDEMLPFTASPKNKWSKNLITWYMYGNGQYNDLVERAFNVWSKHANISFRRDRTNPMILLSFSDIQHICYSGQENCYYDFDGPGYELAHAFVPGLDWNRTDIHFDKYESWDFSMNLPVGKDISFYMTVLHEQGHALGLSHSYISDSIMYPYHYVPSGISNMYDLDLSADDIKAIQYLYGPRLPKNDEIETVTSLITTTEKIIYTDNEPPKKLPPAKSSSDICEFENKIEHLLVIKDRLFLFYKNLVWILNLNPTLRTKQEYTTPNIITDWLSFLPSNFTSITAIYQRPNDEIVLITDLEFYFIQIPNLSLIKILSTKTVVGRNIKKVNGLVSTNQARTYVLTEDWYAFQISECTYRSDFLGDFAKIFPGIPSNIKSVFRYINGKLYFFSDNTVFEFDEFKSIVTRSDVNLFELLEIVCIRDTLLKKLNELIKVI